MIYLLQELSKCLDKNKLYLKLNRTKAHEDGLYRINVENEGDGGVFFGISHQR